MAVSEPDETPRQFAHSATHLARTTQTVHITLSQMADQKASILMGAAFVTFTLAIGQARTGSTSVALVVLAAFAFAFVAAAVAVLAIVPSTSFWRCCAPTRRSSPRWPATPIATLWCWPGGNTGC